MDEESDRGEFDQQALTQAWAEGQAMTLEEAVEYALRDGEA